MKRRAVLEIHRDDHKVDALGRIFLGAIEGEEILVVLRRYLGPAASLHRVEIQDDVIRVEADLREFPEESANLVEVGRSMLRKGLGRSAIGALEEALRLAPLNAEALKTIGRWHYRRRERGAARRYLVRAREADPGDLETLRLLAELAIHDNRPLEARGYLERVLRARPGDQKARAALARLRPADAGDSPQNRGLEESGLQSAGDEDGDPEAGTPRV
ncbi:tetratricopeptide repeat protein [bacterium]|nr:tetratricopeptide repeat protein [bacterium]